MPNLEVSWLRIAEALDSCLRRNDPQKKLYSHYPTKFTIDLQMQDSLHFFRVRLEIKSISNLPLVPELRVMLRGIFCIFCRCHRGRDRYDQLFLPCGGWVASWPKQFLPCLDSFAGAAAFLFRLPGVHPSPIET